SKYLVHLSGGRGKATKATIQLKTNAKTSECERPRCPSRSSYRIPSGKPSTSASGKMEHSTDKIQKRAGMRPTARLFPSNVATNPCVTIVGIRQEFSWRWQRADAIEASPAGVRAPAAATAPHSRVPR